MDHEKLARDVLRALRGKRSQVAFSRRLGYSTNVAYGWESGRRFPTAAEAFRAASRVGVDVRKAVAPFLQQRAPEELEREDPTSSAFVAALLRAVRGSGSMQDLANRAGLGRSAVSRILGGQTEPRLPAFFRLIDVATRRLLDLLAGFVDVSALPAAEGEWARLEALRRLAHDNPLTEVVPRFLELEQYAALPRHEPGWIAERLGIDPRDEQRTLRDLRAAGIAKKRGGKWVLDRQRSVDTGRDPRTAARLRKHWTDFASARIAPGSEGLFSYLVFGADDATLAAMQELRLRYFRELRALVARAPEATRVAVAIVHLFPVDGGEAVGGPTR
jgi:transcriptional regulator with XRE-family HTH domain